MNILVLGASGFLGGNVYHNLIQKQGFQVIGTYFKSSAANNNLIKIDIKDGNSVKGIIDECKPDVVIWCLMDVNNNEKELIDCGLNNVVRSIDDNTKLIYISTDAFADGTGKYSEEAELKYFNYNNAVSEYANAKIDGEKIVKSHWNHAIVRTGPLYGQDVEGNWDKRTSTLIDSLAQKQTIHRSSNLYKTFVCVADLADLVVEIIEIDFKGIIHAGPEQKESYYSFNKKMAHNLGLDENLIIEDIIDRKKAVENSIPLDTSMDTHKCRTTFKTNFRSV